MPVEAEGLRYRLFCLFHMLQGVRRTRRYWLVLLGNKKIRRLLAMRVGAVAFGAFFASAMQGFYFITLFHKNGGEIWFWFVALFVVFMGSFVGFLFGSSMWDGLLQKDHPWLKYREARLKATMQSMFAPMSLRVRLNRVEDTDSTVDRTYALFDWGEYAGTIYLPKQSKYVINIVMDALYSHDGDQYDVMKYYTRTFGNSGMSMLFQRAYLFKQFTREHSKPQPGFGGMVLQQGKDALSLYQQVTADEYAELSFYGVAVADMPQAKNTPLFLLKEVYVPDPLVTEKMSNQLRLNDPDWWINYYETTEVKYHVRLHGHLIAEHKRFAAKDPKLQLP